MKRIIATMAAVLIALTTTAGCSGLAASSSSDKTVDVGIVQLPIFAPVYVAQAKGYFQDAGLKVNLENIKSGQDAIALASSGKLDVVAAGFAAGMFNSFDGGLNVKIVGSMGVAGPSDEKPASALVVSKDLYNSGEITSVADLKGRKIGALGGPAATSAFYVSMALDHAGLSPDDVEFVNLSSPDIPTALKTRAIAAAFVSAPFWNQAVQNDDAVKLWSTPEGTSGTGLLYGGDFADSAQAQKFFDAVARGAQDLQGEARYSNENLKIIGDATGQTPEQVASVPLYHWYPDLRPLPDQLAEMEKTWMAVSALNYPDPLDPKNYVDSNFAEAVPANGGGSGDAASQ